jgi:hypothetical protein
MSETKHDATISVFVVAGISGVVPKVVPVIRHHHNAKEHECADRNTKRITPKAQGT